VQVDREKFVNVAHYNYIINNRRLTVVVLHWASFVSETKTCQHAVSVAAYITFIHHVLPILLMSSRLPCAVVVADVFMSFDVV